MKTNILIKTVVIVLTVILTVKQADSIFANKVINNKLNLISSLKMTNKIEPLKEKTVIKSKNKNTKIISKRYPTYFSEKNTGLLYCVDKIYDNKTIKREFFFSKFSSSTNMIEKSINITEDYNSFLNENKEMRLKEIFVCIDNDIYSINFKNEEFNAEKLNINTKYIETSPCVSPDGNTLYFASNRKGSYGGKDIYASERLSNGKWSTPYNLGNEINTNDDEETPFIMNDAVTLYFSSKGHNSMGGYDVCISTLNYDGIWTSAENLGSTINSTYNDLNFITNDSGENTYYATDKFSKGNYDIIDLTENAILFCPVIRNINDNSIENTAAIYLSIF